MIAIIIGGFISMIVLWIWVYVEYRSYLIESKIKRQKADD